MKKILPILFVSALLCSSTNSFGQEREKILAESEVKDVFEKKFRWGLSWNQYWGTITGTNLPREYFAKPLMGTTLRAQYHFLRSGHDFHRLPHSVSAEEPVAV